MLMRLREVKEELKKGGVGGGKEMEALKEEVRGGRRTGRA